jgi:hypothetical protein
VTKTSSSQHTAAASSVAFSSVVASAQSRHSKVHNSGSAPIPGIARAKRMGLLHFGQSGVGLVRSVLMMPLCALFVRPAFALDQPRRVGSEVGAVKSAIPARGAPLLPACGEKVRMRGRSRLPSTAAGAPKQGSRSRVDTRCHRPTLTAFRGELREELRDRDSGNPLNLIRVMPAKGQEYPESASTSRDSIANTRSRESARTEEDAPCRLRCSSPD